MKVLLGSWLESTVTTGNVAVVLQKQHLCYTDILAGFTFNNRVLLIPANRCLLFTNHDVSTRKVEPYLCCVSTSLSLAFTCSELFDWVRLQSTYQPSAGLFTHLNEALYSSFLLFCLRTCVVMCVSERSSSTPELPGSTFSLSPTTTFTRHASLICQVKR